MKYLADTLTFSRFILATALLLIGIFDPAVDIGVGFLIFIIAELTDAFDGTLATRFPFPEDEAPKYRKYAAKYDMLADALTAIAAIIFFTLRVNLVIGLVIIIGYGLISFIVEMVVYGKLFGHPDNCTPHSLLKRNFKLAKRIIMARRALYLVLIAVVATWLLYASSWGTSAKILITILSALSAVFLWFFLSERRHHISRDAVDIEDSLTKKDVKKQ